MSNVLPDSPLCVNNFTQSIGQASTIPAEYLSFFEEATIIEEMPSRIQPTRVSLPKKDPFSPQELPNFLIQEENLGINQEIENWESIFNQLVKELNENRTTHKAIHKYIKLFNNIRGEVQEHIPFGNFTSIHSYLEASYETIKFLNPLENVALSASKWFALRQAKNELDELCSRFKEHLEKEKQSQSKKKIASLYLKLEIEQEKAFNSSAGEAAKLWVYQIMPLHLTSFLEMAPKEAKKCCKIGYEISHNVTGLDDCRKGNKIAAEWVEHLNDPKEVAISHDAAQQEKMAQKIKLFADALDDCQSSDKAQEILSKANISYSVPQNFEAWEEARKNPRLQEFFIHRFQIHMGESSQFSQEAFHALLENRKIEEAKNRLDQMAASQEKFIALFDGWKNLSLEELKAELANHHIHFEMIREFPTTQEEWIAKSLDADFKLALCSEWVRHFETIDQLLKQGMRASLLQKIEVESNLIKIKGLQRLLGIFFIGIRMSQFIPDICKKLDKLMIYRLTDDLPLPALGILKIFIPKYDLSYASLFIFATDFWAGRYYKPNEYSAQGYYIHFLINKSKFLSQMIFCHDFLKKFILSLQIHFVENLIMKIQLDPNDPRFVELNNKYDEEMAKEKSVQAELKKQLQVLQLKDLNYILQPNQGSEGKTYSPIEHFFEGLLESDLGHSKETVKFFKEHLSLDLENESKEQVISKIKTLLTRDTNDFFNSYECNREEFLN